MSIDRRITTDGFHLDFEWDGDVVTRRITQPKARETLLVNKELRKEKLHETKLGMRPALRMEEVDRYTIAKLFPGINSADSKERSDAWTKFIKSPLSFPYRVQDTI